MSKITDKEVENAVFYFRDKADLVGQLRGQKSYLEHKAKIVLAQEFLNASGTVAERDARAKVSDNYIQTVEEIKCCETELHTVITKLKASELCIDVYRTQAANSRRGHV